MATDFRHKCKWKNSNVNNALESQKWHFGDVRIFHNGQFWFLEFYIDDHRSFSNKLDGEIRKLSVTGERIHISFKSGHSCAISTKYKLGKEQFAKMLRDIESGLSLSSLPPAMKCLANGSSNNNMIRANVDRSGDAPSGVKSTWSGLAKKALDIKTTPTKKENSDPVLSFYGGRAKSDSKQFTRVKDHVPSDSNRIREDDIFDFKTEESTRKNKFLDSSQAKSNETLSSTTNGYHGNQSVFCRSYASGNQKRKPGYLGLDDQGPKRLRPMDSVWANGSTTALLSNRKQQTLDKMTIKRHGPLQGFSNLGNTCYMNSILQSLFCLLPFACDLQIVAQHKLLKDGENRQLLSLTMASLLQTPIKNETASCRELLLAKIKDTISKTARRFSGHGQHDAHEFLSQLLDQLKDEVKGFYDNRFDETLNANSIQRCNPTTENFESEIKQTITCKSCKQESNTNFILNDISLDLPRINRRISLQDCIRQYFKPHTLTYNCEHCHHNEATVAYKFVRLPRILILLLKRYQFNSVIAKHRKVVEDINIPKYVTLDEHCQGDTKAASRLSVSPYEGTTILWMAQCQQQSSIQSRLRDYRIPFVRNTAPKNEKKVELDEDISDDCNYDKDSVKGTSKYFDKTQLQRMSDEEQLEAALNMSKNESGDADHASSVRSPRDVVGAAAPPSGGGRVSPITNDGVSRDVSTDLELFRSPVEREAAGDGDWMKTSTASGKFGSSSSVAAARPPRSNRKVSKTLFLSPDDEVGLSRSDSLPDLIDDNTSAFEFHDYEVIVNSTYLEPSSERKKPRPFSDQLDGDVFTADEDKENILPSYLNIHPTEDEANVVDQQDSPSNPHSHPSPSGASVVDDGVPVEEDDFEKQMEKAIALSLMEVDDDLEKAKRISLGVYHKDANNLSLFGEEEEEEDDQVLSDFLDRTEQEDFIENTVETGTLPRSYRLMSVVSHLGSNSSSGHYVTDVYDISNDQWRVCDDSNVSTTNEENVRTNRQRTGYIFFYLSNDIVDEITKYKSASSSSSSISNVLTVDNSGRSTHI